MLNTLIEPQTTIDPERRFFCNQHIRSLILPLFIEQLLLMLVGIADTFMVSFVGESAVSGVTLMTILNTVFIFIFTSLASGGAVIISQYLGRGDHAHGNTAASQLTDAAGLLGFTATVMMLSFNVPITDLLFRSITTEVRSSALTYIRILAISYPALAVYNAGAALYRSLGKTRTTMTVSILANLINIAGNALALFVFHTGIAGIAWASTLSHYVGAIIMTILGFQSKHPIHYLRSDMLRIDLPMLRRIFRVAIPNSIEAGLFQLTKVVLSSITALFGTTQIAANGIAQSFWSLAALPGVAMGPAFITILGQAAGRGDNEVARYYFAKLLRINTLVSVVWNVFILGLAPLALQFYSISHETRWLVFWLIVIHNVFNAFFHPMMNLSNGLRAVGDIRFATYTGIFTTVVCRTLFSVLFGLVLGWGVIGIAFAMALDWLIRGILLQIRVKGDRWTRHQLIERAS